MKTKLFFLITLFLISFGCKEERKVEIVNLNDDSFMDFNEFDNPPKLSLKEENQDLFLKIENNIRAKGLNLSPTDHYRLLIYMNEKGRFDKVVLLDGNDDKIAGIIIDELSKKIDGPMYKDGKPVKFKFWFPFESGMKDLQLIDEKNQNMLYDQETYFVAVEEMPEPIGGMYAIQEKIIYPEIAKRAGIEGKVFILAFIDENGNVANAKILKGIGAGCDEVALNAVKETKFTSGRQGGKPIKVQITIPIVFKLQ